LWSSHAAQPVSYASSGASSRLSLLSGSPEDERRLLNRIADLPFKEFQFHGFESKRKGRVIRLALRFQRAKGGQRDRLCKQRVGPGTRSQISER